MTGHGLREQNKQQKFERIKQAAKQLFEQKGYEATTTREIAELAHIGTGTLFLYVKDKGELLLLIYADALQQISNEVFTTLPDHLCLQDALMHLFIPLFHFYQQNPGNVRAFFKELLFRSSETSSRHPFSGEQRDFVVARLVQVIRHKQERGELRQDMDPYLAAGGFFALYFASITSWSAAFLALDTRFFDQLRDLFGLQIRGMLP
jgi:AcrR family transcriptional regulator